MAKVLEAEGFFVKRIRQAPPGPGGNQVIYWHKEDQREAATIVELTKKQGVANIRAVYNPNMEHSGEAFRQYELWLERIP